MTEHNRQIGEYRMREEDKIQAYIVTMPQVRNYGRPAEVYGSFPMSEDEVKGAVYSQMLKFHKLPQGVEPSVVRVKGQYVKMAFKVPDYEPGRVPQATINAANKVGGYVMRACKGLQFEPIFVPASMSDQTLIDLLK